MIGAKLKVQKGRSTHIKFEVDTDPPYRGAVEALPVFEPVPFSVVTLAPPELFAGKMHAVLCRQWQQRVKGRDWYDMIFYVGKGVPLNLEHLKAKMVQSGHFADDDDLSVERFQELIGARIDRLDVAKAKADVKPFVRHAVTLDAWSQDFFKQVAGRIRCVEIRRRDHLPV